MSQNGTDQKLLDFGDTSGAHSWTCIHIFTLVLKINTNSSFLKYVIEKFKNFIWSELL